jgi:hypothetical protein
MKIDVGKRGSCLAAPFLYPGTLFRGIFMVEGLERRAYVAEELAGVVKLEIVP